MVFPSKKISRSSNVLQNLFPPKGSLVNAPQKKKKGERKAKEAGRRESLKSVCFLRMPEL